MFPANLAPTLVAAVGLNVVSERTDPEVSQEIEAIVCAKMQIDLRPCSACVTPKMFAQQLQGNQIKSGVCHGPV